MKSKSFICVVALLSLAGCDEFRPMSNDEIIAAHKLCEANGLRAAHLTGGFSMRTMLVECRPYK